MTKTLQQIETKVSRIKGNLVGKHIESDKILGKIQKLDGYIGDTHSYDYQERKSIREIRRAFYQWCKNQRANIREEL